jgi:hypothetical protein
MDLAHDPALLDKLSQCMVGPNVGGTGGDPNAAHALERTALGRDEDALLRFRARRFGGLSSRGTVDRKPEGT